MADWTEQAFTGSTGPVTARWWDHAAPRYVAVLAHGYGEHIGRYGHVADRLRAHGAAVVGPDHAGHGGSGGARVDIADFESVVDDLHAVRRWAADRHPGVPVVVIGHSMGGMIALRYAQRHGAGLAALVLSAPLLGAQQAFAMLAGLPEIPDVPLDPGTLSRDPAVGAAYDADPLVWHGPFKRTTVLAFLHCMDAIENGPSLGDLPTLYAHGERDELVPMANALPAARKVRGARWEEQVYAGAKHEIFNETNKTEVIGDVLAFIDRALAARALR